MTISRKQMLQGFMGLANVPQDEQAKHLAIESEMPTVEELVTSFSKCEAFIEAGVFTEDSFWQFGFDCPKSHWTADVWEMYRTMEEDFYRDSESEEADSGDGKPSFISDEAWASKKLETK